MNTQAKESRKVDFKGTLLQAMHTDNAQIQQMFKANYQFSLLNCLLASHQLHMRGLPMCALKTFKGWNAVDRKVKKGEKAIYMCRPYQFNPKDPKTGEPELNADGTKKMITGFQLKPYWFAYCQTEGSEIDFDELNRIFDFDLACKNLNIERVDFDTTSVNAGGYADVVNRKLAVNPQWQDSVEVASVMFHEMGHILLHKLGDGISREVREIEAESVALLMFKILDIGDTKTQNAYIQHWGNKNSDLITDKLAKRVFRAVNDLLKAGRCQEVQEVGE